MMRIKRVRHKNLTCYLRFLLIIASGISIFLIHGCTVEPEITSHSSNSSISWLQQDGRFMTDDAARAQAEIPFPLRLPTFFPPDEKVSLPLIEGPIRQSAENARIEVSIKYCLQPSNGTIVIREYNKPALPPDPQDEPDYKYMEIGGKEAVKWEGKEGVVYYFNLDGIYFIIEIDNLSPENSVRIVESIISQEK